MIRLVKNAITLIRNIYQDRKLVIALSTQDFRRRFAGSYFGTVWAFVQPIITILIYWVVFQFGFRSGDVGDTPYILWFMCGIIPWLFISEAITMGSNSLLEYSYLVKKVAFHIDILPLVKIISAVFVHFVFLGLLLAVCVIFGVFPTLFTLQVIYYLFASIVFVFAFCLLTSAIMVFFRDLGQIINIILTIGMWGTPIAWNMEQFSEKAQFFLKLNPVYYIVSGYRDAFVGQTWFWEHPVLTVYFWVLTIVLFLVAAAVFKRLKAHFSDVL